MNDLIILGVLRVSIKAGQEILKVYKHLNLEISQKYDNSPITIADKKSHDVILEGLKRIRIDDEVLPVLSEEGEEITYKERKNWKQFWLIDPLDGTKEFIKRNGEFTVNIALIKEHDVFGGVVYAPVKRVLYLGWNGFGSFKIQNIDIDSINEAVKNAVKLNNFYQLNERVNVVASRSHLSIETKQYINKLNNEFQKVNTVSSGSSIKLCMVADGTADVYPRFGPTMEWDTAAAQGVCKYAGIRVIDIKTKDVMKYNRENQLNNWFLVSNNKIFEEIL